MATLKAKLQKKKRKAVRKQIATYEGRVLTPKNVIKDPARIMRDPKTGAMIAASNDDIGTRERRAHDLVEIEGTGQPHARVVTATQLDTLLARKNLAFEKDGDHQRLWLAGDQLRKDFYLAGMQPRVISTLSDAPGGEGEVTDRMIAARRRYQKALAQIGPILSPILVHVICDDQPINGWGKKRGRDQKTISMTLFKAALETLALYYGY